MSFARNRLIVHVNTNGYFLVTNMRVFCICGNSTWYSLPGSNRENMSNSRKKQFASVNTHALIYSLLCTYATSLFLFVPSSNEGCTYRYYEQKYMRFWGCRKKYWNNWKYLFLFFFLSYFSPWQCCPN